MTMPGMLNLSTNPLRPRRSGRSKFIAGMFAAGIIGGLLGGGAAIVGNAPQADATTQATINQFIRANGGIAPCKNEDGSRQRGMCYWDGRVRGNGEGDVIVLVPTEPGQDKRVVVLINR